MRGLRRSRPGSCLRTSELHLARREVGDHDGKTAFESRRVIADLMPANTVRCSVPMSSVSFSNLSAPSTCSAFTILATRRSILAKSSMEMVAGRGFGDLRDRRHGGCGVKRSLSGFPFRCRTVRRVAFLDAGHEMFVRPTRCPRSGYKLRQPISLHRPNLVEKD